MKKHFFILLCLVMLLPFGTTKRVEAAIAFRDVNVYENEISYLAELGIIKGYHNHMFKPKENITRLQAVRMILRAKEVTDFTAPNPNFTDVQPGSHGYEEISKAVAMGIISGKTAEDGTKYFDVSGPVTRGQMAKIISESYGLEKVEDINFKDVPPTNGYKDYISILASENITIGYSDETFRPNNRLTREHFAVFMARLLDTKYRPILPDPNPTPVDPDPRKPNIPHPDDVEQPSGWSKENQDAIVRELQKKNGFQIDSSNTGTGYFSLKPRYFGPGFDFRHDLETRARWFGISYEQLISIINYAINTGEVYDGGSLIVYYDYSSEGFGFLVYSSKNY